MVNVKDLIKQMSEATNVYRTKNYIVIQNISVSRDEHGESMIVSRDAYWQRTVLRDWHYLSKFKERKCLDGRRLHSTTYIRRYIV